MLIMELMKLLLLGQCKLHMKPTTSLYSVIQQCQMPEVFVFYVFRNLKEKYHIRYIVNNKKNM